MNLSPSTACKCVRHHEQNGNFRNTPGRGRKKKLSTLDEKYLKDTSLRNRRKSSKELKRDLKEATGKKVSPRLVRKTLTAAGLGGKVGHLYKITDNLKAPKYKQILIHHAVPVGKALIGNNLVFQHDNDPKHTARVIKKYLENKKRDGSLTVLNWSAQSPDMNIIEQVWTYMEKEKVKRAPVNLQQLWKVLQDIWTNIPVHFIQKLYDIVPRRVNEVYKAKGFHTKY